MLKTFLLTAFTVTALHFSSLPLGADSDADNLVDNPGFENGTSRFYLGVAADSKTMNCRVSVDKANAHTGAQSALMQADDFARVSFGPVATIPVKPAEHYRVGVWVKPGSDFQMQPGTPGLVMRLNLSQDNAPSSAGLIFIFLDDTVFPIGTPPNAPLAITTPLSADWTHIEAVVEVPDNVDGIQPVLFFWKAKGSLNVDDFTFEKVDASVPLSKVVTSAP